MFNRSKIKYTLKKVLPKTVFEVVLNLWQNVLIRLVTTIDRVRLKKFKTYQSIKTSHSGHNFSLFISPKNGFIDKHIFLYGTYEPHILDIIANYLKKGGTFVDIGANIGQHSMFAGSIVGDTGNVYSFEPIPRIYKQLLDSARINHFEKITHAYNIALGETEKTETLYIETDNIGGSSVVGPHGKESEEIVVQIKRADDALENIPRVDIIKIDVEGYEYEVFSGMQKILAQHQPIIIFEFSGKLYTEKGNNDGEKILSLLTKAGYDIYDVENYMRKVDDREEFLSHFEKEQAQTNLLCLPKNKSYEI